MEHGNQSLSASETEAIVGLISLMSVRFIVGSFTVISDLGSTSLAHVQKKASRHNVGIGFEDEIGGLDDRRGYLILGNPLLDFSQMLKTNPRLVVVVVLRKDATPSFQDSLSELVIPQTTSFFFALLSDSDAIEGRGFRMYKPSSGIRMKASPALSYEDFKWKWDAMEQDWSFFRRTLNMSDVTLTVSLVSPMEMALKVFLKGKNSFFWRMLAEHLKFRPNYHHEKINLTEVKSITKVYLRLIATTADGLAILPMITAERNKYLDFVVTGLDSKFHLMVRTPQFVHSWQSILKPFSVDSWICLGVAVLLIATALRAVTLSESSLNFSGCLLTAVGFVCCQSSTGVPKNPSGRLVCYTALIFSMLIYQYYTSNFYSLLSTKEVRLPFTTLEQFLEKKTYSMYVHPDTGIYSDIVKAKNGTLKRLWDEVLKKDPGHQLTIEHRTKAFAKVCKGLGALLGLPFQITHVPELKCKVVYVNSGYFPANIVTIVKKRFPFKPQFNFVQMRLLESGISHKFKDEELNRGLQRAVKTDVINEPVSLEHIAFPLAVYGSAIVLSFLLLALEKMRYGRNRGSGKRVFGPRIIHVKEKLPFPGKP